MSKVIDRIQALIRLATDDGTPETEARAAAFQACRLIDKHDLKLTDETSTKPYAQPQAPPAEPYRHSGSWARGWSEPEHAPEPPSSPPPKPQADPDAPWRPWENYVPPEDDDDDNEPEYKAPWAHKEAPTPAGTRNIICKHGGRCRFCGGRVLAGQPAVWAKGDGVTHTGSCAMWWKNRY